MRFSAFLVVVVLIPEVYAQGVSRPATPLAQGQAYADSLAPTSLHVYTLGLAAGRFVYGEADQLGVDVVVSVVAPDGQRLATFDGTGRGAEPFQFTTEAAGEYQIEIQPIEGDAGRYELEVGRVEPVASDPEGRVDQLLAAFDSDRTPGGVVAVVESGEIVFARGYGMADLEQGVPITPQTPFHVASVSKQFTAFALAVLAEEGRLSLSDDVRTYLPELADLGDPITLRHLLTHTSGLRDQWGLWILAGGRLDDTIRQSDLARLIERQRALNYAPGTEFQYNNTGYLLAATVVERVTGEPFSEWMRRRVFEPLGMESTLVVDDLGRLIRGRAHSYQVGGDGFERAVLNFATYGPTGLSTTAGDLAKWLRNFHTAEVGGRGVMDRMLEPTDVATGDAFEYGLGLAFYDHRGLRRINHSGVDAGYRASLNYYPEIDAGVIVLANVASFSFFDTATEVAETFFASAMDDADAAGVAGSRPSPPTVPVVPAVLDSYVGAYVVGSGPAVRLYNHPYEGPYAVGGGPAVRFTRVEDHLVVETTGHPTLELVALSDTLFQVDTPSADIRVSFRAGPNGHVGQGSFHQNGRATPIRRVDSWQPTAEALDAFAGEYYSPELGTAYTVLVDDGQLVLRHRRHDDTTLTPQEAENSFRGEGQFASVQFDRDSRGVVTDMWVSNGRIRLLRFEKLE